MNKIRIATASASLSVDRAEDLLRLDMVDGELSESMEVASEELQQRILEREVREREQTDCNARRIAAHLILVAVAGNDQASRISISVVT